MVDSNFQGRFDQCALIGMGSLLTHGKVLVSEGNLILKTFYRQKRLFL